LSNSTSSVTSSSFFEQFAVGVLLILVAAALALSWKKIRFLWIKRKITPRLNQITTEYQQEIGEYVETIPKLVVSDKKPGEEPYGFIFITPDEIDAVEQVFLISIPPACSLRRIRLLLDVNLKRAFFDYFSWRLAISRKREDVASKILDNAMRTYPDDFRAMQKLHEENKLSAIALQEALRRLRKYKDLKNISPDDINEYSKIVREWARRDFDLVLVYQNPADDYVAEINRSLARNREVLALARGSYVKRLEKASDICQKTSMGSLYTTRETDVWYSVEQEDTMPVLRVWFKNVHDAHVMPTHSGFDLE
jgi:hypothetical protein